MKFSDIVRTAFHEGSQKGIDRNIYQAWNNDGTFKRLIEGRQAYSTQGKANDALKENSALAQKAFEGTRQEAGRKLQQEQGGPQPSHFVQPPSAAEVDAAHPAGGVPSQGAEAINYVNGKR